MHKRLVARYLVVAVVLGAGAGCSSTQRSAGESAATTAGPTSVTKASVASEPPSPVSALDSTQAPTPTDPPPPETSPETLPEVITEIAGSAVAGNSGGVGPDQTETRSEAVRLADGTCVGWAGPGNGSPWTLGLDVGASISVLDRKLDTVIGSGTIINAEAEDVDPTDGEQWQCRFGFSAKVKGSPQTFRIKVADLQFWVVNADPSRPGEFTTSVSTEASPLIFPDCTDDDFGTAVGEWTVVGQFWADGIPTLCFNGLDVVKIERPCRPANIASDNIITVVDAENPDIVYEDATGLLVDVTTLVPGTKVAVRVATGRPCS